MENTLRYKDRFLGSFITTVLVSMKTTVLSNIEPSVDSYVCHIDIFVTLTYA